MKEALELVDLLHLSVSTSLNEAVERRNNRHSSSYFLSACGNEPETSPPPVLEKGATQKLHRQREVYDAWRLDIVTPNSLIIFTLNKNFFSGTTKLSTCRNNVRAAHNSVPRPQNLPMQQLPSQQNRAPRHRANNDVTTKDRTSNRSNECDNLQKWVELVT